jgi:hypothetical protein
LARALRLDFHRWRRWGFALAEQSNSLPVAGLVVVAALVSGSLLAPQAFDLLRPAERDRVSDVEAVKADVDARLWEDPFAALRRADQEEIEACDERSRFDAGLQSKCARAGRLGVEPAGLKALIGKSTRPLIIAALVSGNPFVGAEETRRRLRYSLLKGLSCAGYVPRDAGHIGRSVVRLPATGFRPDPDGSRRGVALTLPYEFLGPDLNPNAPCIGSTKDRGAYDQVAVLWVDESAFTGHKLDAFAALVAELVPDGADPIRLKILGPNSSGSLRDALADLKDAASHFGALSEAVRHGYRMLARADFFNVFATAPARYLLPAGAGQPDPRPTETQIREFIQDNAAHFGARCKDGAGPCPTFTTTIADDSVAADQITRELCARGVRGPQSAGPAAGGEAGCRPGLGAGQRVVLIGEWDSLYSQTLLKLFDGKLCAQAGTCIESYTYLAGLDGVTVPAAHESGAAGESRSPDAGASPAGGGMGVGSSAVEWPESRDQRDYIRWLAKELSDSEATPADRGLRRLDAIGDTPRAASGNRGRIDAIGLIGSDVHDKLLLLEALRRDFPDRNIFTTDLDSRYLHPRALPFTRNLLVASTYPLQAEPGVPMRDDYQVSTFNAARLAAGDQRSRQAVQASVAFPAMYVIGRTDAHCLPFPREGVQRCGGDAVPRHAAAHRTAYALLMAGVLMLVLVWPGTPSMTRLVQGWSARRDEDGPGPPRGARRGSEFMIFAIASGTALVWFFGSCVEMADPGTLDAGVILGAALISAVLLLVLGALWSRRDRNAAGAPAAGNDPPWWLHYVRLAAVAAALAGPIVLLAWLRQTDLQRILEPAFVSEGVSGWPSQMLRCLALVVAAAALDRAWFEDGESSRALEMCLGIAPRGPGAGAAEAAAAGGAQKAGLFKSMLLYSWIFGWSYEAKKRGSFAMLWSDYLEYGRPWAHAGRIALGVISFVLVAIVLRFWMDADQMPGLPVRGEEHRVLMQVTQIAAGLALVACVVMVIDATLLAARFIWHLNSTRTIYPREVLQRFARSLGKAGEASEWVRPIRADPANRGDGAPSRGHSLLDNWIDVQVVAKLTEKIGSLLLAPFVVLALLLVARSSVFDNWAVTRGLAVVMGGYALLLLAAAVRMKTLAEQTRRWSLESMHADLRWLSGAGDGWSALAEQFRRMIDEVKENRTGAFAPLFNQPLVHAMLLPLGGIGGSQLLDYFLLAR